MHKIILPQTPIGNYWLCDKRSGNEKKLVNIEGINGNWQIKSSGSVKLVNPKFVNVTPDNVKLVREHGNMVDKIILKEYSMHGICFGNSDNVYILYCSPVYENNFIQLLIDHSKEILIGNTKNNHIVYNNTLVSTNHARIFYNNNRWNIENLDPRYGTFVNGSPVPRTGSLLFNGDTIFIMGLRIIIMGNTLFINNPQNKLLYSSKTFKLIDNTIDTSNIVDETEKEDDENISLYSDKDYFFRAPRITNVLETEHIKIDAPPQLQEKDDTPTILVLGSTLTMGLVMMISMTNTVSGVLSGSSSPAKIIFSLLSTIVMLVGMVLFPILNNRYAKFKKEQYEENRQKRYRKYLEDKNRTINEIMFKSKQILSENFVTAEECANIILQKSSRLWERKIEDYDFLTIRLGIGNIPFDIDIDYPEERFSMVDDNLFEPLNEITENSKTLKDAPVTTSLLDKNISSIIVTDNEIMKKFMQDIMIQLIAFHSYDNLKIVFLLSDENKEYWEYVKMLPYVWSQSKDIRFFATSYNDMEEISKYLEEEFQNRVDYEEDYNLFSPYYLIITDDYTKIKNLKIINEILKSKVNLGFSLLCITNNIYQLPNECKIFINIAGNEGTLFENELSSSNQQDIKFDTSTTLFFDKICQMVSNIPIKYTASGTLLLPNHFTFLEMYDVGLIEQLNILDRWKKNDSTISLKAPIGIDSNGHLAFLDLHEKFHGPHGLVAGSTGSGKSEFLITYILSLAINYHPDDVTFCLIDYKGGGLAGAFEKGSIKLPHLVGTITNIETNGLQRSLASIQSELKRRQVIFNNTRNKTDEGTIDIYKYQKLYHNGIVKEPIPHLLIICDEFAELKQQQPEFMEELMSVSRIGRSLGIHLILATQKPAGIVNDQIRSNSKFAICLKVQDKSDSTDVIKRPDAANLKTAGQFYMNVGNDDYFILGQSAWAGAPYYPSALTKKNVDTTIQFISDIGTPIKELDNSEKVKLVSKGEQLTSIVKYIYQLSSQENITTKNLWLADIPENIYLSSLISKYHYSPSKNNINVIIGEYDDPYNQRQGTVDINLNNDGNIAIYGNAESGKETLLSTLVFSLMSCYPTGKVWIYLLDFGTESLRIYKNSPLVGDVVFLSEEEKIKRLFDMLQAEIAERKNKLINYNGSYELYSSKNDDMPIIAVFINNYEAFSETYENTFDDVFQMLTREGTKYGITFIITSSTYNSMRYRLSQNFKKKIALQLNNEDDFYSIYDNIGKRRPANKFGRGFVPLSDNEIYEFQIAKIGEAENYNSLIEELIEELPNHVTLPAKPIPTMPDKLSIDNIQSFSKKISSIPVGMTKEELKLATYNFKKNFTTIITSKNIEYAAEYTSYIIDILKQVPDANITILDAEQLINLTNESIDIAYNQFSFNLQRQLKSAKTSKTQNICIIIGIDKFVNSLDNSSSEMSTLFTNAKTQGNYSFILVDTATKIKGFEFELWFKNYVSKESAIYVGNGIDDQYLLNITNRRGLENTCGRSYGYLINQGEATLIKLIGMKDKSDEDE